MWLVNDDPAQLLVQKRLFGRFAATVWDFDSPLQLVAHAKKHGSCPNLVSDYHMPGMNGLELSQFWCEIHPDAKILLLSASEMNAIEQEKVTYLPSNHVKVLTNYRLPDLLSTAQEWFSCGEPVEANTLRSIPGSNDIKFEFFDTEVHQKLRDLGGVEFLDKTLIRFRDRTPDRIALIEQMVKDKDRSNLHLQAHSLKGSCGVVGATALSECADVIETSATNQEDLAELQGELSSLREVWQNSLQELQLCISKTVR